MLSSFFGVVYFEKPAGAESRLGLKKIINKSLDKLSHWDFKYKNIWVNQAADKGYVGLGEISNNPESKSNVEKYNCVSDALESLDTASLDNFSNLDTDFAFGHWLESEQKLICARDHIGIRPLFYTKTENYFAFASEIKALLVLDDVKKNAKQNEKWLVEYLAHSNLDSNQTYYQNIFRLRGGRSLELHRQSQELKIQKYWSIKNAPNIYFKNSEDYIEAFKEKLWAAVEKRLGFETACELSGGLDSTSIAAVGQDILQKEKQELNCYSHVLPRDIKKLDENYKPKDEYDEIGDFLSFSKISNHKYLSSEKLSAEKAIDRALFLQDAPTSQTFTMFSDELNDRAKEDGCDVLLSGFGGDELATGHAPSWRYELAHANKWWALWFEFNARNNKNDFRLRKIYGNLKKLGLLALELKAPKIYQKLFGKFKNLLYDHDDYSFEDCLINIEFAKKYEIAGRGHGNPAWRYFKSVRKQQEHDFENSRHIALRCESSYIHARHKNLEISFPLMDKDLVEFCIGVPASEKRKMRYGRWLMRRAMHGYVPDSLRLRQHKGGAAIPGAQYRQSLIWDRLGFENLENLKMLDHEKLSEYRKLTMQDFQSNKGNAIMRLSLLYASILNRFLSKQT